MASRSEFIKSRSFEIAWAVFRCADLVKKEKLKIELEGAAVELVAKREQFKSQKHGKLDLPHIDSLLAIIKLAEAVNEIKPINAKVLYRELDNLLRAIKEELFEIEKEDRETGSLIEDIFSKPPAIIHTVQEKDMSSAIRQNIDNLERTEKKSDLKESLASIFIGQEFGNSAKFTHGNSNKAVFDNSANNNAKPNSADNKKTAVLDEGQLDSWQGLIYKKVKELGSISTREISAFFPEISERTVRFYLQKLVESGFVEKIGSTGPGSYYKLPNK